MSVVGVSPNVYVFELHTHCMIAMGNYLPEIELENHRQVCRHLWDTIWVTETFDVLRQGTFQLLVQMVLAMRARGGGGINGA